VLRSRSGGGGNSCGFLGGGSSRFCVGGGIFRGSDFRLKTRSTIPFGWLINRGRRTLYLLFLPALSVLRSRGDGNSLGFLGGGSSRFCVGVGIFRGGLSDFRLKTRNTIPFG